MASLAKISIIGNVGRDAELRMTPRGTAVCEFSVAVGHGKRGEPDEHTDWYRVSCWGRQAEIAQQYVRKGTSIFVDGRFTPRTYTDKTGAVRTSYDISADNFTLLGGRREASEASDDGTVVRPLDASSSAAADDGDLPF